MKEERDYFVNKSYCELVVVSSKIEPKEISQLLGILPDRSFKKREKSISKHSRSTITKPHNLWAITSNVTLSKEESISPHIAQLETRLLGKERTLEGLRKNPDTELTFHIWLETDDAGIGIDLSEQEMLFINAYSNRVCFSFLTNEKL